jgi:hypothetical protein
MGAEGKVRASVQAETNGGIILLVFLLEDTLDTLFKRVSGLFFCWRPRYAAVLLG